MQVFNHYIQTSEIIGIGPLMHRGSRDGEQNALYNPKQLFFLLYCKGHSIEISSDWFELGYTEHLTGHHREERAAFERYQMEYQLLCFQIAILIGDVEAPAPTPAKPKPPKPILKAGDTS